MIETGKWVVMMKGVCANEGSTISSVSKIAGQFVLNRTQNSDAVGMIEVNLKSLVPGAYIVHLSTACGKKAFKIIQKYAPLFLGLPAGGLGLDQGDHSWRLAVAEMDRRIRRQS